MQAVEVEPGALAGEHAHVEALGREGAGTETCECFAFFRKQEVAVARFDLRQNGQEIQEVVAFGQLRFVKRIRWGADSRHFWLQNWATSARIWSDTASWSDCWNQSCGKHWAKAGSRKRGSRKASKPRSSGPRITRPAAWMAFAMAG